MKIRFLIVSGPTIEPIDPVRYISNYSTGTMGKALVVAAKKRGHAVDWVSCPDGAKTARELLALLKKRITQCDVLVMAAAVADARPAFYSDEKIKKEHLRSIRLVRNPDILKSLAKKKKENQVFIGFALETGNVSKLAEEKRKRKNLELIVAQRVTKNKSPFGKTRYDFHLMDASDGYELRKHETKSRLAAVLVRRAEKWFSLKNS